jgi:allantoate deiminase
LSESVRQATPLTDAERAAQIIGRCRELALCTEVGGETTRTFLAPSMHSVHTLLTGWMRAAGMTVRIDAAGNLRGVLAARTPDAPRLVIGSHLDTIANAGAFDGVLGVVMGVTLVEALVEAARSDSASVQGLPFEIEVIGFSEEEGVRFGKPFLGSLALVGQLDSEILARTDRVGVSVGYAIRAFGLDPADLPAAVIDDSVFGYIEFHIEQGPVLESANSGLGVVDSIAGQTRMEFIFSGQANHAGTTPMGPLRRDALAAAAYWIAEIERYADACEGLVATVGKVESSSSAGNVIAGRFVATLDVRHAQDSVRRAAVDHYIEYAEAAGASRGVKVAHTTSIDQTAVPMCSDLSTLLRDAAGRSTRSLPPYITSGAGHDAMIVARRVPAAILFLRSPGGLSHHPDEAVLPDDVHAAFCTGVEFLRSLRDDRAMLERVAGRVLRRRNDNHA